MVALIRQLSDKVFTDNTIYVNGNKPISDITEYMYKS